jgi:hypothetical protein
MSGVPISASSTTMVMFAVAIICSILSVYAPIPKGNSIEILGIRYFYYVIANTLQARGEFTRLNEEEMFVLACAMIPDSNMTPNLGAMLLLHLHRQAHQTRGNITCEGVIAVLANRPGINLGNPHPLNGNRRVSLSVLRSVGMIVTKNGRIYIILKVHGVPMCGFGN